jgi:hypothetical protein
MSGKHKRTKITQLLSASFHNSAEESVVACVVLSLAEGVNVLSTDMLHVWPRLK